MAFRKYETRLCTVMGRLILLRLERRPLVRSYLAGSFTETVSEGVCPWPRAELNDCILLESVRVAGRLLDAQAAVPEPHPLPPVECRPCGLGEATLYCEDEGWVAGVLCARMNDPKPQEKSSGWTRVTPGSSYVVLHFIITTVLLGRAGEPGLDTRVIAMWRFEPESHWS